MVRPKHDQPTPNELEVLKIIWDNGPGTVRDVMERLHHTRPRAYTSVMSLLNVMTDKGLLERRPAGRAFVYYPRVEQKTTQSSLVADLLRRAFEGSASTFVARLLDQSNPTREELDEIRELIESYARESDAQPRKTSRL